MTEETNTYSVPERYAAMDVANKTSWYMTEVDRPFTVTTSIHSLGHERTAIKPDVQTSEEIDFIQERNKAARYMLDGENTSERYIMGGNMSTVRQPDGNVPYGPKELTNDERLADANANMNKYFDSLGINIAHVRVLNPERDYSTPLTVVDVDKDPGEYLGG
jgi:hypothetical protein